MRSPASLLEALLDPDCSVVGGTPLSGKDEPNKEELIDPEFDLHQISAGRSHAYIGVYDWSR
jgi:hypothetical protein